MTSARRSVLITGSSTGIGEATALRLARAGWQVFAGVRREEDGRRLQQRGGPGLRWLLLDVTDAGSIRRAAEELGRAVGAAGLDGLVNNAGIAVGGPLEFIPMDLVREQFEVNVFGLLAVTQAMLPHLRHARGRVVNIGSVSGRIASPMIGPYSASKFALAALTDVLRMELSPWGIMCSVVEVGPVQTPIWEKGDQNLQRAMAAFTPAARELYQMHFAALQRILRYSAKHGLPAERMAATVERALDATRPRPRYVVGTQTRFRLAVASMLPARWMDALVMRILRRAASAP